MVRIACFSLVASFCVLTASSSAEPDAIEKDALKKDDVKKKELTSFFTKCDANSNDQIDIGERTNLRAHVNAALIEGDEIQKLAKVPLALKPGAAAKPMLALLRLRVGKENPDDDGDKIVTLDEFNVFVDDVLAIRQELIANAEAVAAAAPPPVALPVAAGARADDGPDNRRLQEDRARLAQQRRELEERERKDGRELADERERLAREQRRLEEIERDLNSRPVPPLFNPPPDDSPPKADPKKDRNPMPRDSGPKLGLRSEPMVRSEPDKGPGRNLDQKAFQREPQRSEPRREQPRREEPRRQEPKREEPKRSESKREEPKGRDHDSKKSGSRAR